MLGAVLGLISGIVQLWLLIKAVHSITGEKVKLLPMLLQFLCPAVGLLLCAVFARAQLMVCAVCIIAVLLTGSVAAVIIKGRK